MEHVKHAKAVWWQAVWGLIRGGICSRAVSTENESMWAAGVLPSLEGRRALLGRVDSFLKVYLLQAGRLGVARENHLLLLDK